jgi:ABC-type transport system involved in multi-copper enzyme maturation permease subunit
LSYLALLVVGWLIAWPLMSFGPTREIGQLLMGVVPLALIFLTLIQTARVALFGSSPVFAIARNVLNEAVRMKISIVFIVLLLVLMALVPNALTEDQPLRYRVQQWMSYGLGFSYVVLAMLTVFLSVGTVAFEQRDKIIWQTATKPVAAWQYVLGKWAGVMTLNLVLLGVSAGGVYIFTEYLRHQPAVGESAYYVDLRGNSTLGPNRHPSTDRRILERQVLVARVAVEPEPAAPSELRLEMAVRRGMEDMENPPPGTEQRLREEYLDNWQALIEGGVQSKIDQGRARDPNYNPSTKQIAVIRGEMIKEIETGYRSIEPGGQQEYLFDTREVWEAWVRKRDRILRPVIREVDRRIASGQASEDDRERVADAVLREFVEAGRLPPFPEVTLRFTVHAGTNDPTKIYRVYFWINGTPFPPTSSGVPEPTEVALKAAQTLSFPVVLLDANEGILRLGVVSDPSNERTLLFPPDGLQILSPVGGYELNFLRVATVMWVKLGFVAAIGIAAATFLSFSVASLVTLGFLFMAESAGFLSTSLEYYSVKSLEGDVQWSKVLVRAVSLPIAWTFQVYADLRPTEKLVDGRLISWASLAQAIAVIGAWTFAALTVGFLIFRKRELATYSGN